MKYLASLFLFCVSFLAMSCSSSHLEGEEMAERLKAPREVEMIEDIKGGIDIPPEGIIVKGQKGLPPPAQSYSVY